jgi:hypothetical protein
MQQITEGLAAGERVIVDGVMKARPGQKVATRELGTDGVAAQKEAPAKRADSGGA